MQQRSEDAWVPTYDDEEVDDSPWQDKESDVPNDAENDLDAWQDRRVSRRPSRDPEGGTKLRAVLGVFLVVLLGVSAWWGVRALLLPSASTPTPAAIWTPAPLASPVLSPTPVPTVAVGVPLATATPAPAAGAIGVGQRVRVAGTDQEGIRLRSEPGVDYATLVIVEEGVELDVLDGPQEADGYLWWQLEMDDGTVGWAVEDYLESVS